MNLDSIRYKAHRVASHAEQGVVNYNPFARSKASRVSSDIESNPVLRVRSEPESTIEEQRRAESRATEREFGGPRHADTAPISPTSAATANDNAHVGEATSEKDFAGQTATHKKESADLSDKTIVNGNGNGHESGLHKRKLKSLLRKSHDDESPDPAASNEEETLNAEEKKRKALKKKIPVGQQIRAVLLGSWINILLFAVPAGFGLYYAKGSINNSAVPIFVVNFLAIIPLAGMLSYATEELALRVGETFGGLLNATFGNAVELIVSIQALIKNEITIVKTSLIGSMLSNLLLVMGMSFFLGGINRLEQHFNVTVAQTAASLLALCIASLIIPTVFHQMLQTDNASDGTRNQELSRGTAVILLLVYGCYLFFQLKSHVDMYNEPSQKTPKRKSSKVEAGSAERGIAAIGAGTAAAAGGKVNEGKLYKNEEEEEEDDEPEEPQLSVIGALVTLAISTILVAFCSEFMVDSIDSITESGAISKTFVGLILLPIVGNAAEHATAVTVACKDKMDLAIGVAVGSSMQIALLVLPLVVVLGWILDKCAMTLYFDTFQIALLFVAVLLVNYLIQDGKSHWLEGVLLMASYIIIAIAAWFYPNTITEDTTC